MEFDDFQWMLMDGFGYISKLEIIFPPNCLNIGCVQKIGGVHHDLYDVIFESQKVLP